MPLMMSDGSAALWIGVIIVWSMLVFVAGMIVGHYVVTKAKEARHWDES